VTALIAGSIVFIGLSATSLGFGWLGARAELIWVSIAASGASAVCLALAYYRSRTVARRAGEVRPPEPVRVRPAPRTTTTGDETSPALFGPDSGMSE
jgi:hypothetical protein